MSEEANKHELEANCPYSYICFLSSDTFQKEKIIFEPIYDNFALNNMTFK